MYTMIDGPGPTMHSASFFFSQECVRARNVHADCAFKLPMHVFI